jgi:hypothetical protein
MNYAENLTYLAEDAGSSTYATDPSFLEQLPYWILAGEDRICRDLDLLNTYVEDDTGALSANRRIFILPTGIGTFQVITTVRVILPGPPITTLPALTPISREAMDSFYPDDGATGNPSVPRYWCPNDQLTILVGPGPDQPYPVKLWGTQRPKTLSATNTTTFISTWLPDLFHAAEMRLVMAWQRQFNPQAEEAMGAVTWDGEYERLLKAADVEEMRKRLSSQGWSSRLPNPVATPPLA